MARDCRRGQAPTWQAAATSQAAESAGLVTVTVTHHVTVRASPSGRGRLPVTRRRRASCRWQPGGPTAAAAAAGLREP